MMKSSVFRQVRFSLYAAFILSGIFLWRAPVTYRCNVSNETCFGCGLKHAVDLLLQGKLTEAYVSNPFIAGIVIAVAVMAIDVVLYYCKRLKTK